MSTPTYEKPKKGKSGASCNPIWKIVRITVDINNSDGYPVHKERIIYSGEEIGLSEALKGYTRNPILVKMPVNKGNIEYHYMDNFGSIILYSHILPN